MLLPRKHQGICLAATSLFPIGFKSLFIPRSAWLDGDHNRSRFLKRVGAAAAAAQKRHVSDR